MTDLTQPPQLNGQWNYPNTIHFGVGKITQLPQYCQQLEIGRPLLVTDQGVAGLPFMTDIFDRLSLAGLEPVIFSDVKPNPNGSNIRQGVDCYRENRRDGIIAIGGGSGLDAGKAIALMVGQTRPIWDFEDIDDNYLRVNAQRVAPIIAIPTTAGTGSEVGRAAVIVDEQTQHKKIIFHPKMLPSLVVADPALTQGLPAPITAATGMDAFVHSLEAYCAPGYHPMADAIALEGMRLVKDHLPAAFTDGNNLVARSHMLVASTMGATAFQKGLGGVHALAHPIGANYDAHHGLLNAILLPYVLRRNRAAIEEKISNIAYHLRLEQPDFDGFMQWLEQFSAGLQIPTSLGSIGISLDPQQRQAQKIGQQAALDPSASGNPIVLEAKDYSAIFIEAVKGRDSS